MNIVTPPAADPATQVSRSAPGQRWRFALAFWLTAYRRTWRASIGSGFVGPLVFLGSIGFGLGSLLDARGQGIVGGVDYVMFVAPGLLAASAMQTGALDATYPVYGAVKWGRQYHAMLASPLTVVDVMAGHAVFLALRVAFGALAFAVVGLLVGAFGSWTVVLAVPVAVLGAMAVTLPVMAYAVQAESDGGFMVIFRIIVLPMFLFAGTFFPVDSMPPALQVIAWVTPLWHATEVCRDAALGAAATAATSVHVGYLLAWVAAGCAIAARCYGRRLVV